MSRKNNGIYNPNAGPKMKEPDTWHDGKRALTYALIVGVTIMGNFGVGRALQSSANSIYEEGHFRDGMYYTDRPGVNAMFYCGEEGTVLKREQVPGEMGETVEFNEDMGHPTACPELTPRDGKFWQEKINQLGLIGIAYKQF